MAKKAPAGSLPAAAPDAPEAEQPAGVRARVLCDCVIEGVKRRANDVITVVDPAPYAGQIDADPAAVAYAESLRR